MTCPDEQARFIQLHARHLVVRWQWHFGEMMLRATTDRGVTATISRRGLSRLIEAGLIELHGLAWVKLTEAGRASVASVERLEDVA